MKVPICFSCKNFIKNKEYTCTAFPKGIPREILFDEIDHKEPLRDQENKIVYEPNEGALRAMRMLENNENQIMRHCYMQLKLLIQPI